MSVRSLERILAILCTGAVVSSAQSSKISKDLIISSAPEHNVIVQYAAAPGAAQIDRVRSKGGKLKTTFTGVKGAAFVVPAAAIAELAADPEVAYISPDRTVGGTLDYAAPAVYANTARDLGYTGASVGVAVIDSGVTPVADLGNRVVYSQNFVPYSTTTEDEYGHGTHVAGIIAGSGASSYGTKYTKTFYGVATAAKIVNLKVLDQFGVGSDSAVIAAIDRAIALKSTYKIKVINLSLGRPVWESYKTDPLCVAVEAAWKNGITVVVAAGNLGRLNVTGNMGYATILSPGNDPYVITVGAMKTMGTAIRSDDAVASYSSKGPSYIDHVVKPDIVAPGNRTISLLQKTARLDTIFSSNIVPVNYYKDNSSLATSSDYFKLSGTSMATPVVSGAAALIAAADTKATPDVIKARLMKTATKNFPLYTTATDPITGVSYTSQYDVFTIGAGYLDVMAALNNRETFNAKTALSPTASFSSTTNTVSVVYPSGSVWNSNVAWGTNVIWGTQTISSNNVIWGTGVVWGTSGSLDATNVIWGTNVAWGTNVIWGTEVIWGESLVYGEGLNITVNGEN